MNENKAVMPGEDLEVTFRTNRLLSSHTYLYVVKDKERIRWVGQLSLNCT
jgi:hypothetical protein